ncbi:MAG TPA: hypothetical protein VFI45_00750, partial [Candidatus Acidoferrum sp.]|nr:hypothetical protein [Candidatus Acidoferrum sp.]
MAAKVIGAAGGGYSFTSWIASAGLFPALLLSCAATSGSDTRASFVPQMKPGQALFYEVHGRINRSVKTQSNVSTLFGPQQLQGDLSGRIRLSVQKVAAGKPHPVVSVQTELLPGASTEPGSQAPPAQKLTFDILGDGQLGNIQHLDDLAPEQRLVWQFWIARFAFG